LIPSTAMAIPLTTSCWIRSSDQRFKSRYSCEASPQRALYDSISPVVHAQGAIFPTRYSMTVDGFQPLNLSWCLSVSTVPPLQFGLQRWVVRLHLFLAGSRGVLGVFFGFWVAFEGPAPGVDRLLHLNMRTSNGLQRSVEGLRVYQGDIITASGDLRWVLR
jgi:hypothetical protein